jgi:site-specific DNA-methyltransferase (adenine-specific)
MNDIFNDNVPLKTETPAFAKHVLPAVPSSEVYLEDCVTALKRFADNHFDLAIVDPPYGIGDTFIGFSSGAKKGKLERIHKEMKWDDTIPNKEYFEELKRVSKKQIIWGANYFNSFENNGGALVWFKNRGGNTLSQCEIASVSGQKKVDYVAIQILTGFVSNEERIHPTQKPVKLYDWVLNQYAKPNDLILDTHLGSGSSRIAAYKNGFDFVAFEIDPEHYEKQEKRFNDFKSQLRLF